MIKGYAGRVLEVDLATQTAEFKPLDESIARHYIGGKGYGTRLHLEAIRQERLCAIHRKSFAIKI